MSRIHEALKRAQQERDANRAGGVAEEPVAQGRAVPEADHAPPEITIVPAAGPEKKDAEIAPAKRNLDDLLVSCRRPVWKPDTNFLVFAKQGPFVAGAEQFRTLRSRLYRIRESQQLRLLLLTSALPAEGKSIVTANLSQAIARQQGCRVLLIDGDLRSPRLHHLFGAPPGPGLAEYLQGGASESEIIQHGTEEGLYFIPAGMHVTHPSELLANGRLKKLLERVGPVFDWVIFDSPPVLLVADACVIGNLCDGVMLVVRAGVTPSATAQKACQDLKGANVLGVLLNAMKETPGYGSYYGYGNYGIEPSKHAQNKK